MVFKIILLLTLGLLAIGACSPQQFPSTGSIPDLNSLKSPGNNQNPQNPTPPPATPTPTPNSPGVRIHPANPHYLQDVATGQPILVAVYGTTAPSTPNLDYIAEINMNIAQQQNYTRIWHLLPWEGSDAWWPWARSSVGGAYMGGNKFDFNTWDPVYWSRLKDAMARLTEGKIIGELMLFDRCGLSPAEQRRYGNNAWASNNNINNMEMPPGNQDGTPEFYEYYKRPNLRSFQEAYVRKLIDESLKYNIIYEIENEHWQSDDTRFADYFGNFVKSYVQQKAPGLNRLVSYSSLEEDLEAFYTLNSVDIINKHFGNEAEDDPHILNQYIESRWKYNKPINIDEFANGVTSGSLLRQMTWTIITSGGHFHIEDAQAPSNPWGVVDNIRRFLVESQWDFIASAPNKALSEGYCMANPGTEYVCYFPTGGNKNLKALPAGNYTLKWWSPRNGGFYNVSSFTHGGGTKPMSTPDNNDYVLWVKKAQPTP